MTSLAAAVGAALLMVAAGAPPAAPTETSSDRVTAAVEIAVVGSEADLLRVRALVRPKPASGAIRWRRLDSFRAPQILDADSGARSAATRCWIDLADARRAHLYFVGRSGTRFLIRDVELSGRFDELDLTSLAEVIDLSLAAVIDDERAGISRAEAEHLLAPPPVRSVAPPLAVETAARATPAWNRSIRAGVFYAAQTFASSLPLVSGPGLVISAPVMGADRWQLGAWLAGQYQVAGDATGDLASVRLATIATRAGACALRALGAPQSARWAIELRAGAGADTIHLTPQPGTNNGAAMLTPARWSTSVALTAAAGVATTFGSDRFRLGARLYADVLPIATHYDVAVDGQATTVVAPDRVRPGLAVDLTIALGSAR